VKSPFAIHDPKTLVLYMSQELNRRLAKKVAVVTGASSGVGRSIALALAAEGADLALLGRRMSLLEAVQKECGSHGVRTAGYSVDLLKEEEVKEVSKRVLGNFAGIDILVHSAGVIVLSSVAAASLNDFELQYRCNVIAPFALTQLFLPALAERQGHIVFINSTAGLVAAAGLSQYSATKHALKAFADGLREEINPRGIRVLSVYLGRTATPMQAAVHHSEGKAYVPEQLIQPDQVASVIVCALTLGPEAEITDLRIRPTAKPGTSASAGKT
jgi:short-subunit dehydrogenase